MRIALVPLVSETVEVLVALLGGFVWGRFGGR